MSGKTFGYLFIGLVLLLGFGQHSWEYYLKKKEVFGK